MVDLGWFNGPLNTFKAMSSQSVYLHTFPGQASSCKQLISTCAHSFPRNLQMLLNQQKDDRRKYFMIDLHERIVKDPVGIKPVKIFHDQSP